MLFGRVITSRPSLVLGWLFLTDSINTIELVLMEREFDSKAVKAVCEDHSVYYLNPKRTLNSETEHCRQLAARNGTVDVVEREPVDAPDHCQLYVPKRNGPQVTTDDVQRILVPPEADDDETKSDRQDELWDDLEETLATDVDADDDVDDQRHAAARLMRRYRHRWEIENAYKRFKPFMAETTSTDFALRYFYFGFAALVLYNLWKVVGMLVAERMDVAAEEVDLPASTALTLIGKDTGVG